MGKAIIFGDNIDTDLIIPGEYLNISDPKELGKLCMEGYEHEFAGKIENDDVFVAGKNFGCGSSREHAPISIKSAGVSCIIAESFARIFYRNAINIGLPILESKEAANSIKAGDEIKVSFSKGEIYNLSQNKTYTFAPFPRYILELIEHGGMVNHLGRV